MVEHLFIGNNMRIVRNIPVIHALVLRLPRHGMYQISTKFVFESDDQQNVFI